MAAPDARCRRIYSVESVCAYARPDFTRHENNSAPNRRRLNRTRLIGAWASSATVRRSRNRRESVQMPRDSLSIHATNGEVQLFDRQLLIGRRFRNSNAWQLRALPRTPFRANLTIGENNRPIGLHLNLQRKRFKIKRIGRLSPPYLVQSVHARHERMFRDQLQQCGHHDWPDKATTRPSGFGGPCPDSLYVRGTSRVSGPPEGASHALRPRAKEWHVARRRSLRAEAFGMPGQRCRVAYQSVYDYACHVRLTGSERIRRDASFT